MNRPLALAELYSQGVEFFRELQRDVRDLWQDVIQNGWNEQRVAIAIRLVFVDNPHSVLDELDELVPENRPMNKTRLVRTDPVFSLFGPWSNQVFQ